MSSRYRYRTRKGMTPEKAHEIRQQYATGQYSQSELGRMHNMRQDAICKILNHYYWNYPKYQR